MTTPKKTALRNSVTARLLSCIHRRAPLTIIKAPPGSGKTYNIMQGLALGLHRGYRLAVATQTNSQADSLSRGFARDFPRLPVIRLAASDAEAPDDLPGNLQWLRHTNRLPPASCIVVATSDKWTCIRSFQPFDWLFIDEAWQLTWAKFSLLDKLAPRFVLVGDPGQIDPVVRIDTSRWGTSWRRPHAPAPTALLEDSGYDHTVIELPLTTRLPYDTAALVRPFYDFYFDSWSGPGERRLTFQAAWQEQSEDRICEAMTAASMTAMTLPTPVGGPPRDDDPELAAAVARLIQRLLERKAHYQTEEDPQPRLLKAEDIGVAATHRVMVTRFKESLGDLNQAIRVDTPERWQGLERQVMVVMHPLSGKMQPSSFDLDTGRLNVMLSRHRVACVIAGRDHIDETLQSYAPRAEQAPGREDHVGAGHSRNLEFWRSLGKMGRIVQLKKD